MSSLPFRIAPVESAADLAATVALFRAYAASLDVDLAYQDFESELAAMPGKYAAPAGALLLARDMAGEPAGCVALRPVSAGDACEMKRLYVAPRGRGHGLGRLLVEALAGRARAIGYRRMLLDTLPSMLEAQALYRKLGFETVAPYYDSPVAGTVFMCRRLDEAPGQAALR